MKIWEDQNSDRGSYTASISGNWQVHAHEDGTATVGVDDCGCCGVIDLADVASIEEFDAEWARIGGMLREQVQRALAAPKEEK